MEAGVHCLCPFDPDIVTLFLFENVSNIKDIKNLVVSNQIRASFLSPQFIVDPFQVLVSTYKALNAEKNSTLKTRNVYSEIIYNLSPTKNIAESLKKFGIGDNDRETLVVVLKRDLESANSIGNLVKGTLLSLDQLHRFTDELSVKKVWKIPDSELTNSILLDSVVSRIATKDV